MKKKKKKTKEAMIEEAMQMVSFWLSNGVKEELLIKYVLKMMVLRVICCILSVVLIGSFCFDTKL